MKYLITVFFLFLSVNANSEIIMHTTTIKWIDQRSDGTWVMAFNNDNTACTNKNTPSKYYHVMVGQEGVTEESSKNLMSLALTAAISKKTVYVSFNTENEACFVNRIIVNF